MSEAQRRSPPIGPRAWHLFLLADGWTTMPDLVEATQLDEAAIRPHLHRLIDAGLITARDLGRSPSYKRSEGVPAERIASAQQKVKEGRLANFEMTLANPRNRALVGLELIPALMIETFPDKLAVKASERRGVAKVRVNGSFQINAEYVCDCTLHFDFTASSGAHVGTMQVPMTDVHPWRKQRFWHREEIAEPWAAQIAAATYRVQVDRLVAREDPKPGVGKSGTMVPLAEWRGVKASTGKPVRASCHHCNATWRIAASVANALATEQGLGGRMQRGGKAMQAFGADLSLAPISGAVSRYSLDRDNQRLAGVRSQFACPSCLSLDVWLGKTG